MGLGERFPGLEVLDLDLNTSERAPRRHRPSLRRVVRPGEGHHAAALGESVGIHVAGRGEQGVDGPQGIGGCHVVHQPDALEFVGIPVGVVDHGLGDRREGGEAHRGLLIAHLGDGLCRVEVSDGDIGRTRVQAADERQNRAHVEQGERVPEHIGVGQLEPRPTGGDRGAHQRLVIQRAALGLGGGTRGVDHEGFVADGHLGAEQFHFVVGGVVGQGRERSPVHHSVRGRAAQQNHCFELGSDVEIEVGRISGLGQARKTIVEDHHVVGELVDDVAGDQHLQVGVLGDVGQFPPLEPGVDGNRNGANEGGPEHHLDEVHAVGHEDPHPVLRPNPQPQQRPSRPPGRVLQRIEAVPGIRKHHRVPVPKQRRPPHHQIAISGHINPSAHPRSFARSLLSGRNVPTATH